jgi:hypothetical protein
MAPTSGQSQAAARAHVPAADDTMSEAAPDAGDLAGLEAAVYAVGLPRVLDVEDYLEGNPLSQPYFDNLPGDEIPLADNEVLGLVTLGGNYSSGGTGNRVYTSSATFAIDLGQLQTPRQELVLALLDASPQSSGFDSLQFQVTREGSLVVNQTFMTLDAANAFFNDNAMRIGSNAADQVSGALDLVFSMTLTTNDVGAGFAFDLLFGNATFASADFDGDGDIDGNDLMVWQRNVGVGTTRATGDADGNGMVNAADLTVWRDQFGFMASTAPATAAVPEPGAAVLCVMALACFRRRRG